MRFRLKYLLLASLLLGAFGVPWGWEMCREWQSRAYQTRKAAEIKRLEKELAELWETEPNDAVVGLRQWEVVSTDHAAHQEWQQRVKQIRARLEKLTGKRPERRVPTTHDTEPLQGAPVGNYTVGFPRVEGPIDAATEAKMEEYLMRMSTKRMTATQ